MQRVVAAEHWLTGAAGVHALAGQTGCMMGNYSPVAVEASAREVGSPAAVEESYLAQNPLVLML
jgi:hypothetical protein